MQYARLQCRPSGKHAQGGFPLNAPTVLPVADVSRFRRSIKKFNRLSIVRSIQVAKAVLFITTGCKAAPIHCDDVKRRFHVMVCITGSARGQEDGNPRGWRFCTRPLLLTLKHGCAPSAAHENEVLQ